MSTANVPDESYDVFLGGACNPTTWRRDTAIPYLEQHQITYFNPQQDSWHSGLIEVEKLAKINSRFLLFVFDPIKTRGLASLIEIAYLAAQSRSLILVIPEVTIPIGIFNGLEQPLVQPAFDFISEVVAKQDGKRVFKNLSSALAFIHDRLGDDSLINTLLTYNSMKSSCISKSNKFKLIVHGLSNADYNAKLLIEDFIHDNYPTGFPFVILGETANSSRHVINSDSPLLLCYISQHSNIRSQVEASFYMGLGYETILVVEMLPHASSERGTAKARTPQSPDSGIGDSGSPVVSSSAINDYNRARSYLLQTAKELPNVHVADSIDGALEILLALPKCRLK